jgi:hypothetical protein
MRESAEKDVKNIWESGLPLQHCKERKEWSWELQRVNDSSSIVLNIVISLYNQMVSPVDVGDLPNHVKYCVSVLSLQ